MKEIKFRAWDKDEKQWLNIKHFGFDDKELWYVQAIDENEKDIDPPYFIDRDEIELMQYTGLKDKNGKEIYEGDILKDDSKQLKQVLFKSGTFGCEVKKRKSFYSDEMVNIYYSLSEYVLGGIDLEVIGNIHENPDLISK